MHVLKNFYEGLIEAGTLFQHLFLLAIRLYWGYSFQSAGLHKLNSIRETASFFSAQHIPFPEATAYLVGGIEFIGGWLLILGLFTRLISIPLAITMIVALLTVHWAGTSQFFSNPSAFQIEAPVTYLLTALTLFCFGPGVISLDYAVKKLVLKK